MAEGITAARTALADPDGGRLDATLAALSAGVAAADADANARGGLCVVHALSCVAAAAWHDLPFPAIAAALAPPVLRAWAARRGSSTESAEVADGLAALAATALR